jgi:hypothetical protein
VKDRGRRVGEREGRGRAAQSLLLKASTSLPSTHEHTHTHTHEHTHTRTHTHTQVYMIPEGSESGSLHLYRALDFPRQWEREAVLIDQPLVDASVFFDKGEWWMFASNRRDPSCKSCRQLELW